MLNSADLILKNNQKLQKEIAILRQENTALISKTTKQTNLANKAIKQAKDKEQQLEKIIEDRVETEVWEKIFEEEERLDKREETLKKEHRKYIVIFSIVVVIVTVILLIFSWRVSQKNQTANALLEENNTRLTKVKELESKISDKSKQSASSSSTDNLTTSQSSKETKEPVKSYEQLKQEVDQLYEDSRPINPAEQIQSARQRYDTVKQDVENAKDNISFKSYNELKVQLMLAKSTLD